MNDFTIHAKVVHVKRFHISTTNPKNQGKYLTNAKAFRLVFFQGLKRTNLNLNGMWYRMGKVQIPVAITDRLFIVELMLNVALIYERNSKQHFSEK